MSSVAEKRWMGRVANMGCIVCELLGLGEDTPAQVHHIREGRIARNDLLTLPLCPAHHTGSLESMHHGKDALMRRLGLHSEFDLLAIVIERCARLHVA